MLVFNMKMGQDAVRIDSSRKNEKPKLTSIRWHKQVIRKTLVGFRPKNKSKKKKIGAAQSFRQALQRRKNDPLWIYKHDFETDVIDNLESKMEERKRKAAILVQKIFRGRVRRRDLEAQRSYDPVDIVVLFREERLGIRFEDLYLCSWKDASTAQQ